jgi:flagellar motor switch protein FliG
VGGDDPELRVIARNLRETDPATRGRLIRALPEQVRSIVVDHMVGFASLPELDDGTVQMLLRRVNQTAMARALVDAPESVVRKVLGNLSRHAAAMYREDMERLAESDAETVAEARLEVTRLLRQIYQERPD